LYKTPPKKWGGLVAIKFKILKEAKMKNYILLDAILEKNSMTLKSRKQKVEESHMNYFFENFKTITRTYVAEKPRYFDIRSGDELSWNKVRKTFWLWVEQKLFDLEKLE
jgi:hypothetical protein